MLFLRVLILAIVIALGTVLLGWWTVPIAGALYGLLARGARRPGLTAAVAAMVAWGGYLSIGAATGAPVGTFGAQLARAMQLPVWAPIAATLVFPAILAGCAGVIGGAIAGRRASRRAA